MIVALDLGFYFSPGRTVPDWGGLGTCLVARPHLVAVHQSLIERLAAIPLPPGHLLVATSGSTAVDGDVVRLVALSAEAFLASASAVNAHLEVTRRDVWAHALPMFHVGGLGILARASLSGSRVVPAIHEKWNARHFHATVVAERATLGALVPSQVHDLVEEGLSAPPSMRAIVVGGARLDPGLYAAALDLGWPCLPSYGMTETCSQVATADPHSMSRTCPAVLPVLSHANVRIGAGGRIHVRAASLLTGYVTLDLPAGAARFDDPKQDGWLVTEDLGRVHGGGIEVLGRAVDSVKVLGELVDLVAVEAAVGRWIADDGEWRTQVADIAIAAVSHPRSGAALVLAVVPAPGVPASAIRTDRLGEALGGVLRGVEKPAEIRAVASIPRTPLGKVQRARLAELLR